MEKFTNNKMYMQETINQLESMVNKYTALLQNIAEADYVFVPAPGKWSRKQILGHLVDSAQNNIRRFVVTQYENQPQVLYAQDEWVKAANYQQYDTRALIELWALLNRHACMVLKNIPAGAEKKECKTNELHSIEWVAADYVKHLLHHLHQIVGLEPIPYP